jgi:hypothetical protein
MWLQYDSPAPPATKPGDLSEAPHLPTTALDCVIITQTLMLIYDMLAAITCPTPDPEGRRRRAGHHGPPQPDP